MAPDMDAPPIAPGTTAYRSAAATKDDTGEAARSRASGSMVPALRFSKRKGLVLQCRQQPVRLAWTEA